MSKLVWWCAGSGRIELKLPLDGAEGCHHPGPCDDDVRELSRVPAVAQQLAALDPGVVRDELREYGAWDTAELANHEQNLQRLLWLACGDIADEDAPDFVD